MHGRRGAARDTTQHPARLGPPNPNPNPNPDPDPDPNPDPNPNPNPDADAEQGRPVREHPVIDALLRHRLLIERLRPLDQKLKYRLQKLLQLASGAEASSLSESQRELQLRPNPDAMLLRNGDAADLEADGEEGGAAAAGGAYRPPKLAAVPYEEEKGSAKRERQRQRQVHRPPAPPRAGRGPHPRPHPSPSPSPSPNPNPNLSPDPSPSPTLSPSRCSARPTRGWCASCARR